MSDTDTRFALRMPASLRQRLNEAAAADGRSSGGLARRLLENALDPQAPLSNSDKATYGHSARRHPVLGFLLEDGVGALPIDAQAALFIKSVEASHGKAAADVLRRELAAAQKEQT